MSRAIRALRRRPALAVGLLAIALSVSGAAQAARAVVADVVSEPRPNAVLELDAHGDFPARVLPFAVSTTPQRGAALRLSPLTAKLPEGALPTVREARTASRLGGVMARSWREHCPPGSVDVGTWCVDEKPLASQPYREAARTCAARGAQLPPADLLLGAASRIRLASTIDDSGATAVIDTDHGDGRRDLRELTGTLVSVRSGTRAAGDARTAPVPAGLQAVTVYDNHDRGGFAGSVPLTAPLMFRCAGDQSLGDPKR